MKEKDYKVQVRAYPNYWLFEREVKDYNVQIRIVPSELNWFKRTFFNSWRNVYHCIWSEMFPLSIENGCEIKRYQKMFKTLNDVNKFEFNEYCRAKKKQEEQEKKFNERSKIFY